MTKGINFAKDFLFENVINTLAQLSWLKRTADNRKRSGSIPDASTKTGSTW